MRILVTGGEGMLGRDVAAAATRAGHEPLALGSAACDVTDPASVAAALDAFGPDAVVNCAAWTDVDAAESREPEALAVNGEGAGNVAAAAAGRGAFLVHVSTDYVFDGGARQPYVESAPVGPLSAYGRTKLAGERAVQAAAPGAAIVRTAWLFGVHGGCFPATMLRLAEERDEVTVVTDQIGCPTWTGHLADALVGLAGRRAGGIHHAAGAGQCSWHDFAVEIFRQAGAHCRVLPGTSEALARPAARPAWSVLAPTREDTPRLPAWQEGLTGYLAARAALGERSAA